METITRELVKDWLPMREPDAHKGDFGRLLIAAGSEGMMGACILACRAAFRSGSGLVSAACPSPQFTAVHAGVPEATCVTRENLDFSKYDAIAAGSGLGVSRDAYELICRILREYQGPFVLDADGLNCLSEYGIPSPSDFSSHLVLTPHAGEAARLVNASGWDPEEQVTPRVVALWREEFGTLLAKKLNAVCVMKGRGSLVCCPDGTVFENTTGNAGMATGGSGDVLTGIIASLAGQNAAQGLKAESSAAAGAVCGVYLHGLAGDMAAERWGKDGLMASDLADFAALARKSLAEQIDK